ncbi:MAG: LytR/AlgR family response regulator transcription factor [Bacteroidales bacterium]
MEIKVFLIDDEPHSINLVRSILENHSDVKIVGVESNPDEVISHVRFTRPDLIVCDIEMPGITGVDLVKQLRDLNYSTDVIFLTAHKNYALDAYKIHPFDYILKPVDPFEIYDSINRWQKMRIQKSATSGHHLINNTVEAYEKLRFNNMNGFILVKPDDILYCEAKGNYTLLNLISENSEMISQNLGTLEEKLSKYRFFRLNRSFLVNLQYIVEVDKKKKLCRLKHEELMIDLPVSIKRVRELEKFI